PQRRARRPCQSGSGPIGPVTLCPRTTLPETRHARREAPDLGHFRHQREECEMQKVTAAAIQATPVFLDREATVDKAVRLIREAGSNGAGLMVFPETFIPTYPDWVW